MNNPELEERFSKVFGTTPGAPSGARRMGAVQDLKKRLAKLTTQPPSAGNLSERMELLRRDASPPPASVADIQERLLKLNGNLTKGGSSCKTKQDVLEDYDFGDEDLLDELEDGEEAIGPGGLATLTRGGKSGDLLQRLAEFDKLASRTTVDAGSEHMLANAMSPQRAVEAFLGTVLDCHGEGTGASSRAGVMDGEGTGGHDQGRSSARTGVGTLTTRSTEDEEERLFQMVMDEVRLQELENNPPSGP
ncbi:unnamed protein product [Discosporangium mesarthrocarpum]